MIKGNPLTLLLPIMATGGATPYSGSKNNIVLNVFRGYDSSSAVAGNYLLQPYDVTPLNISEYLGTIGRWRVFFPGNFTTLAGYLEIFWSGTGIEPGSKIVELGELSPVPNLTPVTADLLILKNMLSNVAAASGVCGYANLNEYLAWDAGEGDYVTPTGLIAPYFVQAAPYGMSNADMVGKYLIPIRYVATQYVLDSQPLVWQINSFATESIETEEGPEDRDTINTTPVVGAISLLNWLRGAEPNSPQVGTSFVVMNRNPFAVTVDTLPDPAPEGYGGSLGIPPDADVDWRFEPIGDLDLAADSVQYLKVRADAYIGGRETDPNLYPVEFAFRADGDTDDLVWHDAVWNAAGQARLLVGPAKDVEFEAGLYQWWVRVVAAPETTMVRLPNSLRVY